MSVLSRWFGTEAKEPTVQEQLGAKLATLETKLAERWLESMDLYANYVDPRDRTVDPDGTRWIMVGNGKDDRSATDYSNFGNETELTEARDYCRKLARKNPFAINLLENLASYIAGEGHKYNVIAKQGEEISDDQLAKVQDVLDELLEANQWCARQQEIVIRLHRDGEVFLRKFVGADQQTLWRFVEPHRIRQPDTNPDATWGIECDPDDVETVKAYHIAPAKQGEAWERVDASEIQHRKINVDSTVKRGVPTIWPIGSILERVGRLMENMGIIAEIQTAIAMIRRHMGATKSGLQNMRATAADYTVSSQTGKTEFYERRKKGAIIDASANTEYDFPPSPDVSGWIEGAQFNLRGAASRVCFPEFMFTSDASNANYASSMVAEGPAVRIFQRMQASMIEDDHELIMEALELLAGMFGAELLERVDIKAEAPTAEVRDLKAETETYKMQLEIKAVSLQTVSALLGYEYEKEQANIEQHEKDHPDQMQQAEIGVLQAKAQLDPLQAADKQARMEAVESYLGGNG